MREKLIEILKQAPFEGKVLDEWRWEEKIARIADHLIANGVTIPVKCKDCRYYNEDSEYCGFWGEVRHMEHFCDEGLKDNGSC